VAIIDHHRDAPTTETLGLKPGTPLASWIDEDADSASLMAAAAVRTLAERNGGVPKDWSHVTDPLAAGAATDTGWFSKSSTKQESLPIFKHLLSGSPGRLQSLRQRLGYRLPGAAKHLLDRTVKVHVSSDHGHSAVWMSAGRRSMQEALQIAQSSDPDVTLSDISGTLMDRLDTLALQHGVAVLLQSDPNEGVRISIRSSDPEVAGELARAVGGGGKQGSGGAHVEKTNLVQARQSVQQVLDRWVLGQTSQLRLRGSA
jgi:nanoRNase/pAp phosphatase (c-di-AMP/oligoRNAs hydrolase)